jgi:nanoRNase/pAp phosphatase (c-di-AMP/oligoRNAs hydrolase)
MTNSPPEEEPPLRRPDNCRSFPKNLESRVAAFRQQVSGASSILILTHDYPDPDCIASAYGISHLLSFWGHANSIISFGGFVGRAENRAMIRFLNISTIPYVLLEIKDYDCIVLADCFPGRNNVSLPASIPVNAVLDHHPVDNAGNFPFFNEVRQDIGATATIVTEFLLYADCPIPPKLATGLFYGIMTDTGNMGRGSFAEDLECYKILFNGMDHSLLAQIEHPDRDIEFFKVLHRAAQSMVIFDSVGYVPLGRVTSPDYIGEMVDIFHGLEKIEFTICTGIFKKNIFFSIRSKTRNEAGAIAEAVAALLNGGGGGHGKAGAGRIPFQPHQGEKTLSAFVAVLKEALQLGSAEGVAII